jgi:hypothetical protein
MRALNVFAALAVGLGAASNQVIAQTPQGHGIAGFWSMAPGPTPPRRAATPAETELIAQFRAGALLLADAGATEFPPGDYGGLKVHASLREAAKSYDPENQTDVSLTCRPPGVIYSMQGPFPIEIFEGRDLVVIKLEYFDLVRRFRLADENTLLVTQQFEDSGSFEGTAARIMSFRRGDDHVYPYDCDPTYGLAIDSRGGPDRE